MKQTNNFTYKYCFKVQRSDKFKEKRNKYTLLTAKGKATSEQKAWSTY